MSTSQSITITASITIGTDEAWDDVNVEEVAEIMKRHIERDFDALCERVEREREGDHGMPWEADIEWADD